MKKWMWIVIIVFVLIVAAVGLVIGTAIWMTKPDAEYVWKFVQKHPEKASVTYVRNGEIMAQTEPDRVMPLASTVKIIVAIEYAKQAAAGTVSPDESVKLKQLEPYYLANLDGGAHPSWLSEMESKQLVKDGAVPLEEVAKGMIVFSSNANTEYLMEKLGLANINRNLGELGLNHHEPLYPFVSSLLIPYELMQSYKGLGKKEALVRAKAELAGMPAEMLRTKAADIHEKLKWDDDGVYKRQANIVDWYDGELDRMNSDKLIGATTAEYAGLLAKINGRNVFAPAIQKHLQTVLEGLMQNPANRLWLEHAGSKGGSTAFVLTQAIYATDKEGNRTELAIFFNDLDKMQMEKLSSSLNVFGQKLLQDAEFRDKAAPGMDSRP
ncbi:MULTISPECIES: serine hydrolase [unclassified Paenibacillus]|uniref:serine hydrolase n=1 Tax=unclassified Paenibacillus TaxID=185978 RepID=UPI00362EFB13